MNKHIDLYEYGLTEKIKQEYEAMECHGYLGRVTAQYTNIYRVVTEKAEVIAEVSGKLNFNAHSLTDYPAVGDWVILDRDQNDSGDAIIQSIIPRFSLFSRQVSGKKSDEQAVAANINTIFICMAFGHDYNLRRLERYLSIAYSSGAVPVIVLTKSDLCDDVETKVLDVQNIAFGVEVLIVSSLTQVGLDNIKAHIHPTKTIAFIGSSGVGKSTLINLLCGEERLKTRDVRKDERGRHTTSHRELIKLPEGGIVIDTPGMRELQIHSADLQTSFSDIEELSKSCHFSNCSHENEPDCAVKLAIEEGRLDEERLLSYKKLNKELEYDQDRAVLHPKQLEKKKIIKMMGSLDAQKKMKDKKHR